MLPPHLLESLTLAFLLVLAPLTAAPLTAQEKVPAETPTAESQPEESFEEEILEDVDLWRGNADLSLVVSEGNSQTESVGFESTLRRDAEISLFRLRLQATRADKADDRFRQIDPGFTWLPGGLPPDDVSTSLVKPPTQLDVEKYLIEASFEKDLPTGFGERLPGFFRWHAGASWDSNRDAGIVGRTIVFGGLGHTWWDREDLRFRSRYGFGWTERREDQPDPEKEESFPAFRFDWEFMKQFARAATFEHSWIVNGNLRDPHDYSMEMVNALAVGVTQRLAIRVSLQWLFNNEPALEDLDLKANVVVVDPDGVPGSGDEFFQSVESGGIEATFWTVRERKESLDTVFRTSLVIRF